MKTEVYYKMYSCKNIINRKLINFIEIYEIKHLIFVKYRYFLPGINYRNRILNSSKNYYV